MTTDPARSPKPEKPRFVVRADGTIEPKRKPAPRVEVGDHWPERPAILSRSDGSYAARLLELSPHMPGPPAA